MLTRNGATLVRQDTLRGSLYHLGGFPGLVLDDRGEVHGEVWNVPDISIITDTTDRYEGYLPGDEANSLYIRRKVELTDGPVWVYEYNRPVHEDRLVENGKWI